MSEGPRYYLEIAIRQVVDAVIADADLRQLSILADAIEEGVFAMYVKPLHMRPPPMHAEATSMNAAASDVRRQARQEKEAAARLETAKQQRPGETDAEHAARMRLWGLSDD